MTPEQLKASILQRAMEGKLVPQDPTDEPASELLKRIKAEKEKLIADGKIKRDKKETELFRAADGKPYEKLADGTVQEIEVPYDIPDSWEWVRLASILDVRDGTHNTPKYVEKGVPLLTSKNLVNGKILKEPSQLISIKDSIEINKRSKVDENDILLAMIGTVGNPVLVPKLDYDFSVKNVAILKHNTELDMKFTYYFIHYHSIELKRISSGAVQNFVSLRTLRQILSPLPPLSEQKRIVEQIERALEKVDAYSESYNKLQELDKSFPDKLKKSILQYAMQGKLVPQDPNDEPVEVLLEKIQAEKQKLYEEGKLKKKDLAEIVVTKRDDNSPYGKIPQNWFFLTIKDIFSITTGLSYKKTDLAITKNGVRIIRGGNISPFSFKILDNDYYIDSKFITSETVYLKRNQLVTPVSTSLEHIGKFARIDRDYPNTVAGGFVFQLTPFVSSDVLSKYLLFNLSSPIFYKQLKSITKLSGQALYNIPKTKLNELLVPLAPSTEQERISQRVEQLFEKVNQL
ncbi:restriction endonuclease subunit S [Streptococcus suis]|uniref:restriction endonuclease subunit S n=1 Tax=Streptococcus suis TaxID=1307 RepID=UPI0024126DA8|nr:restriction endonuclease subunit S [Streptococcus suis]MDG4519352.1 restriction endonuclease subunit S [Streptococcus suis]